MRTRELPLDCIKATRYTASLLVFLSPKEEVDMDEPLSNSLEKEQDELLTIVGDTEVGEPCIFGNVMYLSVFYYFCYELGVSTYMSEGQVSEERDPDLNEEEDTIIDEIRDEYWRDFSEEVKNKKKMQYLRWDIHVKYKVELIKREFLVTVPHPKGGAIFWTCVKDHIIDEKEDYKDIGLRGFDYKAMLMNKQIGRAVCSSA